MTELITISIPKRLYKRASDLARKRNQPVEDVLETAISLAEVAFTSPANAEEAMMREETAYQGLHPELMARYVGEYIAIYQGQLIDHDWDELTLLRRLDTQYPNEVVLMKQVRSLPEPELRFRSPRFVRNGS